MPDEERDLTSEEESRVRRLLADARLDEPVPPDVSARLDRVLAKLAAGDPVATTDAAPAEVVDLAARRRRRAGAMLVAAAAVVAVGIGLGQVVGPADQGEDSGAAMESDAAVDRDEAPAEKESPDASAVEDGAEAEASGPDVRDGRGFLRRADRPARIGEKDFATDVRRLQPRDAANLSSSYSRNADGSFQSDDFRCGGAAWGAGILFAVRYDGKPAVLAFRKPAGETQVVALLQCGSGDVLRSTTLPYP